MSSNRDSSNLCQAMSGYFGTTFSSLRERNFRLYCLGVIVSLTGSLMQEIVVVWLAYQMTGSGFVLGSIMFSFQAPMIVIGVLGGYAADRLDRRRVIFATQLMAFSISAAWFALSSTGALQLWHMYALSAVFGCVVAFEMPARFALIPQLVQDENGMNAFSLDGLLFFTARVLGPIVGALGLATIGATACFGLNSLTYLFELATIAMMLPKPRTGDTSVGLRQAFAFAYGTPEIRRVLLLVAVFTFCGVYIPMMPLFTTALGGNAGTNGILIATSEVGAILGSIYLANRTADRAYLQMLKRYIGLAGLSFALCLLLVSWSHNLLLSLALMVPSGLSLTLVLIGGHALIQDKTEDRMRGVISTVFWTYSYFGAFALGGPTIGWLVDHIGLTPAISLAALTCATAALYYLRAARPLAPTG